MAHLAVRGQIIYIGAMPQTKKPETDKRSQRQKFMDAAREAGASGDDHVFRKAVKRVASAPSAKPKKAARKPK